MNWDFNPRTHEECDELYVFKSRWSVISIHALTRSATAHHNPIHLFRKISIHALTRSATSLYKWPNLCSVISIHALTRSATTMSCWRSVCSIDFNPRTHEECDAATFREGLQDSLFQSTHSRGVRLFLSAIRASESIFQSTHSRGVRLAQDNTSSYPCEFQSTHSRGVRQ